ncbi:LCP family glycopolymer transferase [Streptomonospora alba]|uniref:LCP family glycopolymer transferase n=1 Tax=Streptomonospora alba TaxID=183763 RepID=UPI000699ED6F|nr:LCP family protein [Streptomonospora alba]
MPDDAPGSDSGAAGSDRPERPGSPGADTADTPSPPDGAAEADDAGRGGADAGETEEAAATDTADAPTGTGADGAASEAGAGAEQDGVPGSAPAKPAGTAAAGRGRRLPRAAAWTAVALVLVLTAGVATAYGYYRSLQGDIIRHDLDTALDEADRPEKIGDDLNILFIGSDGREGGNAAYGGRDFVGERSDALMLAHISTDGRVTVINVPRDSLVDLPECAPYGETEGTPAYHGMINAALFHGGPPCVVKTVESLTGIRVDHFAHLTFVGFREMVDAIGGVEMCIPRPMHDERAKLDLDAGRQRLDGEEALSFVRARYEIGNGGDIGRIDRQQMFLGALADEAADSDLLTHPSQATGMLRALSEHTGTDGAFTLPTMVSIASTLAGTDPSDIAFYTVPWQRAPFDANRVVWDADAAARLFSAVRHDRPVEDRLLITGEQEADGSEGDADASGTGDAEGADAASPQTDDASDPVAGTEDAAEPSVSPGGGEPSADEPITGRDATSNPCANGLGRGTQDTEESAEPQM